MKTIGTIVLSWLSRMDANISRCSTITLIQLPDSVRAAYVFRNGVHEAFLKDLHRDVVVADRAAGPCAFTWSDTRCVFVPAEPQG
jgi:hypothetical protein